MCESHDDASSHEEADPSDEPPVGLLVCRDAVGGSDLAGTGDLDLDDGVLDQRFALGGGAVVEDPVDVFGDVVEFGVRGRCRCAREAVGEFIAARPSRATSIMIAKSRTPTSLLRSTLSSSRWTSVDVMDRGGRAAKRQPPTGGTAVPNRSGVMPCKYRNLRTENDKGPFGPTVF